jgi:NTE family protein
MKQKRLAFVLGGGGARGALQVGALRALNESGYQPDLMVGTSVGAVNAAFLAINGFTGQGLDLLVQAWQDAAREDLLSPNYLRLTLRVLFGRPAGAYSQQMQEFFTAHGLSPDLRFRDLSGFRLVMVAADLNSGKPVLYGQGPEQSVLEGLLASTAIPPWISPRQNEDQLLIDGGALSCLPIEPALELGAEQIIAMDLLDLRGTLSVGDGFTQFVYKYITAAEKRQSELELALAAARRVPVRYLPLIPPEPLPIWDFKHAPGLIECGYEITRQAISDWQPARRSSWIRLFPERQTVHHSKN